MKIFFHGLEIDKFIKFYNTDFFSITFFSFEQLDKKNFFVDLDVRS